MPIQDRRAEPAREGVETRIQFRAGEQLLAFLVGRATRMGISSPDLQARAEVGIWRAVMAAELRRIPLTLAEATCLASILKGHPLSRGPVSASIPICYAECYQAFQLAREAADESQSGTRWGVSENILLGKLQRLGAAADLALEDAVARWHAGDLDPSPEGFAEAGLRIVASPPELSQRGRKEGPQ